MAHASHHTVQTQRRHHHLPVLPKDYSTLCGLVPCARADTRSSHRLQTQLVRCSTWVRCLGLLPRRSDCITRRPLQHIRLSVALAHDLVVNAHIRKLSQVLVQDRLLAGYLRGCRSPSNPFVWFGCTKLWNGGLYEVLLVFLQVGGKWCDGCFLDYHHFEHDHDVLRLLLLQVYGLHVHGRTHLRPVQKTQRLLQRLLPASR